MKFTEKAFFRFLIVGALNTGLSYAVYLAILSIADYKIAYTISYAFGILIAYLLNRFFVFRARFSWRGLLQYPLVYATQYVIGLFLLATEIHWLGMDARLAPILNVILLIPVTYLLNKWVLVGRSKNAPIL